MYGTGDEARSARFFGLKFPKSLRGSGVSGAGDDGYEEYAIGALAPGLVPADFSAIVRIGFGEEGGVM